MEVQLVYCAVWNYEPQAVGLVSELMDRYKRKVSRFVLVPSDKGRFEITVDGKPVYSKLETGEFPKNEQITRALDKVIG